MENARDDSLLKRLMVPIGSIIKRQKIAFRARNQYHQFAWGCRAKYLTNEVSAARHTAKDSVFEGYALCAEKVISIRGLTWARRAWLDFEEIDWLTCHRLIHSLSDRASLLKNKSPWQECFPVDSVERFRVAAGKHVWNCFADNLNGVHLPVTGSHGDMTHKNIGLDAESERVLIFDWEYFDLKGSVFADIAKLCLFQNLHQHDRYEISQLEKMSNIQSGRELVKLTARQFTLLGLLSLSLMDRPWVSIEQRASKICI